MAHTIAHRRAIAEQRRLIERLITQAERASKATFYDQVEWLRSKTAIAELERAIRARRDPIDPDLLAQAARVLARVNTQTQIKAARAIGRSAQNAIAYDEENTRAVRAMQRREDRFERDFTREQAQNVKRILADGISRGENPRAIARDIRNGLGLTPYQSRIVSNYRRALEEGNAANALRRALRDRRKDSKIARGELTESEIDDLVRGYRESWVDHRAEMFARRESHRSVHEGAEDLWKQATDSGDVAKQDLIREWISTSDTRTRDHHRSMDGQRRKLGVAFRSGLGNDLMFPGDPAAPSEEVEGCRCTVATIFV